MARALIAAMFAALALASSTARAADITPFQLSRSAGYFWQGPYVGANLGYQWASVSNSAAKPSGVVGGGQAGYNWQSGNLVFGVETDLQGSGANDRFAPWQFSNPWFGTLRARGGVATSNLLFYGTVGLAYGSLTATNTITGLSESRTSAGWAAGAGIEIGLTANWTARTEYLYVDLNDRSYAVTTAAHGLGASLLRVGLNYRF